MSNVKWNNKVKLIISDVDETIADLYVKAEPEMIQELTQLLQEGVAVFFVTGQGLKSVQWRIIDLDTTENKKSYLSWSLQRCRSMGI